MDRTERKRRIKEIEEELSYKESQFWEDSPHHDMKISALRRELADLKEEDSLFSYKKFMNLLDSFFKRGK